MTPISIAEAKTSIGKITNIVKSRDEGKKAMYTISNKQLSELIANVTKTSKKIPVLCSDDYCC